MSIDDYLFHIELGRCPFQLKRYWYGSLLNSLVATAAKNIWRGGSQINCFSALQEVAKTEENTYRSLQLKVEALRIRTKKSARTTFRSVPFHLPMAPIRKPAARVPVARLRSRQ